MCTGAEIGLILAAVGTGTQVVNNQIALKRQDREAARGIRRQGELQAETNRLLGEQIDDIAGSTGETERAESLAGFQDALRRSEESTVGALPGDAAVGAAAPRFAEAVQQGLNKIRQASGDQAGRLSVIDSALFQRMNEGDRVANTVTDMREQARRSRAEDFITQLRIADRRPNEFVNALGSIMQGAGSAMSMGAFPFGGGEATKAFKAGTLIDAPMSTPGFNPFANAVRVA